MPNFTGLSSRPYPSHPKLTFWSQKIYSVNRERARGNGALPLEAPVTACLTTTRAKSSPCQSSASKNGVQNCLLKFDV